MAVMALVVAAPLCAEQEPKTVIDGRCQYPEPVAQYRNETTLILCDTVKIDRSETITTLAFTRRSWGAMARFAGDMPGNKMTVSQITLRNGRSVAAKGTCEIFYRRDGSLAVISCLAKAGSRSIAANFIPSRI
ncbi:MAG: hypothetical protein ACK4ZW_11960 [Blastomonas sp.]